MSNKAENNVTSLLRKSLEAEKLEVNLNRGALYRYRDFMILFLKKSKGDSWQTFLWKYLSTIEAVVVLFGSVFGFYILYYAGDDNRHVHFVAWTMYFAISTIVIIISRAIPRGMAELVVEAEKIQYYNVLRRLAAKVTLFDIITDIDVKDDIFARNNHSLYIPKYEELEADDRSTISMCADENSTICNSRQTNIRLKNRNLVEGKTEKLGEATKQIVDLCEHLFAGSNYSAKIYLRTAICIENDEVEILASFSKYPVNFTSEDSFGSSWVKARGNPSQVWQCLESGKSDVKNDFDGDYYRSMLLVCLPGRIGVLAITSKQDEAFGNRPDDWLTKALAVSSRTLILQALD